MPEIADIFINDERKVFEKEFLSVIIGWEDSGKMDNETFTG